MKTVFLLLLFVLFSLESFSAEECSLSSQESIYFNAIAQIQRNTPLWLAFPQNTQFVVFDFENDSPGFLISNGDTIAENTISSVLRKCEEKNLWSFVNPLMRTQMNYYPHCGQEASVEACAYFPQVKSIFDTIQVPLGIHVLDRDRFQSILTLIFGDGLKYSIDQIGVYNNIHEMFHEYQDSSGFSNAGDNSNVAWESCLSSDPVWAQRYEAEREWWPTKLQKIYDLKTSKNDLENIAREFIRDIRPHTPHFEACDQGLASHERLEGTAHFVGHQALVDLDMASGDFLAKIDSQYLKVPIDVHSVMWVYATGGAISMLNDKIIGPDWKTLVKDGATPYQVLKNFLEKDNE